MPIIRPHTNRLQGEIQMRQMCRRTLHPHLHQSKNNRREVCKLWRPSPCQLYRMQIPPHTNKETRNPQTHKRLEPTTTESRAASQRTKPNPNKKRNSKNKHQNQTTESTAPNTNNGTQKTQNKTDQIAQLIGKLLIQFSKTKPTLQQKMDFITTTSELIQTINEH
jgi:hypothetical protein